MGQFDKLNQLEKRAFGAEESASEVRWEQADEIARLLGSGLTQVQVASGWTNLKTGKSYHQSYVGKYAQLAKKPASSRGDFRETFEAAFPDKRNGRHDQPKGGTLPSNEEGRVSMLEQLADKLYEEHDWSPGEITSTIYSRLRPAADVAQAVGRGAKVEPSEVTDYDLLDKTILPAIAKLSNQMTQRAANKAQQAILALDTKLVKSGFEQALV